MNSMRCAQLIYHPSLFDYTSPVTNLIPLLFVPKLSKTKQNKHCLKFHGIQISRTHTLLQTSPPLPVPLLGDSLWTNINTQCTIIV